MEYFIARNKSYLLHINTFQHINVAQSQIINIKLKKHDAI